MNNLARSLQGKEIGAKDKNGKEIHIGDHVTSDRGYKGTVSFGIYGEGKHYGIYIAWDEDDDLTPTNLRQDIRFWLDKISVHPDPAETESEDQPQTE